MSFYTKFINKVRAPFINNAKQKMEVRPWDSIPEDDGFSYDVVLGQAVPPPWKREDYLKAATGWVYACITAIAEEVAGIDLHVFKYEGNEVKEQFENPLLDLLYKVNSFTTKFDHWYLTQQYLEIMGEAPWALDRGESGTEVPTAIYLLRPDKLEIKFDENKLIGEYIYKIDSKHEETFKPSEIILIKYPSLYRPFRGRGTLEACTQTIDLDRYSEQWNTNFFYNSARPDAVLKTSKKLTEPQFNRLSKQWEKKYQGLSKTAKVAILEEGMEYQQLQLTQKDMDFLEQQRFTRDKIFSIFRVPKSVVAISDDVNRANAETQAYAFARWTIKPKMKRIVEQLNEFLAPMFGEDLYIEFDDPVPENTEVKLMEYEKALNYNNSWMTVNEVRRLEGLPDVEGGDSIYRPIMASPVGDVMKMIEMKSKGSKDEKKSISEIQKSMNARNRKRKKIDGLVNDAIRAVIKSHYKKNGSVDSIDKKKKNVVKKITDTELFWKKQISIEEEYEGMMLAKLKDIFKEQEEKTIKKLEQQSKSVTAKYYGKSDGFKEKYWYDMKLSIPKVLLDIDEENDQMFVTFKPIIDSSVMAGGQYIFDILGLDSKFSRNEAVTQFLKKYIIKFSDNVNKTTNKKITDQLSEGISEGEGVDKISKRIKEVFKEAETSRANMIARTEVSRSVNFATTEAYKQSGVVKGKEWLTALDERTCEFCASMNGKTIKLDESFVDRGDNVQGDDGGKMDVDYSDVGEPPLHVSCRCTTIPVLK